MTTPFTQNTLEWYNEGRQIAKTRFFDTYYAQVMLKVKEERPRCTDAEDLVSEIFCKFFSMNLKFDTIGNLEYYLTRTIKTMCRDFKEKAATPVIKMERVEEHNKNIEDRAADLAEMRQTVRVLHDLGNRILSPQ